MPDSGELFFRTFSQDKFCVVEVGDIGSIIDKKISGKIFDPFFTTKKKGVGLGLSIAHKIADQHQGKLTANNQKGKTIFSLFLPKNHR